MAGRPLRRARIQRAVQNGTDRMTEELFGEDGLEAFYGAKSTIHTLVTRINFLEQYPDWSEDDREALREVK